MTEKRKMRSIWQEFHQKKFISLYNREKQKKLKKWETDCVKLKKIRMPENIWNI